VPPSTDERLQPSSPRQPASPAPGQEPARSSPDDQQPAPSSPARQAPATSSDRPATSSSGQLAPSYNVVCRTQERITENHWRCLGDAELEQRDTKLYADMFEVFTDEDRALAVGNVVFWQGDSRIAADRAEFSIETKLGTFYNAYGISKMPPRRPKVAPDRLGIPQPAVEDAYVYFFGETIEKIGAKRYRITDGGFTTCVQPTPRWDLHAGTMTLNIDDYVLLRDAVFKVKGVPMLYLPILYYPTKEDERATGFLIPTYGYSTLRGQMISNAFFWAINRSHDATFMHDWFTQTGQGSGGEYRYALGTGDGDIRGYVLNETPPEIDDSAGEEPAESTRSYEFRGALNQLLTPTMRLRARVDYFSSITSMQSFNTNIRDSSRSQRVIGANVVRGWRAYVLQAAFDRTESFYDTTDSIVSGATPRVTVIGTDRPLTPRSQIYFSVRGDYSQLVRERRREDLVIDSSLGRLDVLPQLRYPFKTWPFFTVNSTLSWRNTFYTRSQDPANIDPDTGLAVIVNDPLNRQYFTLTAQAVGPVLNRVWNTPDNRYAERFKHTIEPSLQVQRTSSVPDFYRIVQNDSVDGVVGTTSYTYGVANRIYARRRVGLRTQVREIVTIGLRQTYNTDERATLYEREYAAIPSDEPASHFTPAFLDVRALPNDVVNATLRAEFDGRYKEFRRMTIGGAYNSATFDASANWTKDFFIENLPPFNNPDSLRQYLNVRTDVQTRNSRLGGHYSFNWDISQAQLLQQRIVGFYNAQCCGLSLEYQKLRLGRSGSVPDRRFFLSFTLAGIGNFSPFNGAMGTVPR
jgi:LPS-assembly protein